MEEGEGGNWRKEEGKGGRWRRKVEAGRKGNTRHIILGGR